MLNSKEQILLLSCPNTIENKSWETSLEDNVIPGNYPLEKGIYSTMPAYPCSITDKNLRIPLYEYHLARLVDNYSKVYRKGYEKNKIHEIFTSALEHISGKISKKHALRVRLILLKEEARVVFSLLEDRSEMRKNGISALSLQISRKNPEVKTYADKSSAEAKKIAKDGNCEEAILLNDSNEVLEGASSNVFWISDQKEIFTPKGNILEGVTRQLIMQLCTVKFSRPVIGELLKSREVFISRSTDGIIPLIQIDGVKIRNGIVGDITRTLMEKVQQSHREMCTTFEGVL